MIKKVYALKKGWKPGIYMNWLDLYDQIQDYKDYDMHSFPYNDELKDEGEDVEGSLAYALKQAKLYLEEDNVKEITEESNKVSQEVKIERIPFDRLNVSTYSQEDNPFEDVDDKMAVLYDMKKEDEAIFKMLQFQHESYGNSPWLELLLDSVGSERSYVTPAPGGGSYYTGRYSCASLYTGLLFLILNPDFYLDKYFLTTARTEYERESLKQAFKKSAEYRCLKKQLSHLEAIDLNEVRYRNRAVADREERSRLVYDFKEYKHMKAYIKRGNHTLIDLYKELITNTVYRKVLLEISGPYKNADFENSIENETKDVSLPLLVMQTSAISIALKEKIIGQNDAIDKLEKAFFHTEKENKLNQKKEGPRNVYLFAGPPGVGKTFMAENFAKTLGLPYKRFDMSSYAHKGTVDEIQGISTFYKDSKAGVLTSFVKENPRSVLLFDEIEKADVAVIQLFLRILDEGVGFDRYYDANVSFKDTIIIMTTNAAKQLYNSGLNENLTLLPDSVVIDALEKDIDVNTKTPVFPPEIISRLSSHTIIVFNHLKAGAIRKVIKNDTMIQLSETERRYGYDIKTGSDCLAATVQFSAGVKADARNASKLAGKTIDKELYKFLSLAEEKVGLNNQGIIEKIEWEMDFSNADEEIKELYNGEKNCVIAVFGDIKEIHSQVFQKNSVQVKCTKDIEEYEEIIRKDNILLTLIDYEYGLEKQNKNLNIADANTFGKKAYMKVKKYSDYLPVYILLKEDGYKYSQREKEELCHNGIEDFIQTDKLHLCLEEIYRDVCCQNAIETLALRHQLLTYETRNEIDLNEKSGKIVFYNLKLEVAVDAEDKSTMLSDELRPNKKWTDIYVTNDVKNELQYFIHYLQNPKEYIKKGVRVPKGVLMYGPPGTGKTSLAKVVATESDINFLSVSADELMQGGSNFVHQQFRVARKYAPAVFFIDEIDAIGMNREYSGVNSTLNALLTEMDGFKKVDDKPVFIMAATNLGAAIDPALARRFDRTFCVDLPDKDARRWILERLVKLHNNMFDITNKELNSIVDRSAGMSPAALENVVETALREGIRSNKKVDDFIFDEVFEKCHYGDVREVDSEDEIKNTAYHEAGHALIYMYYGKKPDYMSIVARGDFGGYVLTTEKTYHPTKEKMLEKICAILGGRAAELEFGYGITPGAASDLKHATLIATKMVCSYGMYEEEVGLAVVSEENLHKYPNAERQVNQILTQQLKIAREIIDKKRDVMERLVHAVMHNEQKYLTQKELLELYYGEVGE